MPVLLGATGGTERHSLALEHALRPLFTYLRARACRPASSPRPRTGASPGELDARIERAAGELAVMVTGSGRARRPPSDPYDASAFSVAFAAAAVGLAGRLGPGPPEPDQPDDRHTSGTKPYPMP